MIDDCGECDGGNESCSGCTDSEAANYDEDATIDDGSCVYFEYFTDIPDQTGVNQLVIIENIFGLSPGDEIGLYDTNGLLNSGDCSDEYGDLLVGAGIYDGEQMNIVGIGSIDFCDFPDGYQLSGWVEDNAIDIRLWDQSQNYEYAPADLSFETGGIWGELYSIVSDLDGSIYGCTDPEALNYDEYATTDDGTCIYTITQDLYLDGVILNNVSLYHDPIEADVEDIFSDVNIILVTNDEGDYYIPGSNVNTIGDWELGKGYQVLVGGFDDVEVSIEGYPIDASQNPIEL